jgi:hypothetical protein
MTSLWKYSISFLLGEKTKAFEIYWFTQSYKQEKLEEPGFKLNVLGSQITLFSIFVW